MEIILHDKTEVGLTRRSSRSLTEYQHFNGTTRIQKEIFTRQGDLISTYTLNSDGSEYYSDLAETSRTQTTTDSAGLKTVTDKLHGALTLWTSDWLNGIGFSEPTGATHVSTTYGENGAPVQASFRTDSAQGLSPIVTETDEDGRVRRAYQRANACGSDEGLFKAVFEYNVNGKLALSKVYFLDELILSTSLTYDAQGHIIKSITDEEGLQRTEVFDYEFDSQGNWTKQTVSHALGAEITRRKLEYY